MNGIRKTTVEFINDAMLIHDNTYDYSKVKYINNKTKVCVICKIHGEFYPTPNNHISKKSGCPKCRDIAIGLYNLEQCRTSFKIKAYDVHGDKYRYNNVKYFGAKHKVYITCNVHGDFRQTPNDHLSGYGCPICNGNSKGEDVISKYLKTNDVYFIPQYSFDDCRDINPLPFDFYIPSKNLLIEFDGKQHFEPVEYFGGVDGYNSTVSHDMIKNQYATNNEIKLLRISYLQFDKLYDILDLI